MSGYRNVWGDNFAGVAEIFENAMLRPPSRGEEGDDALEARIDEALETEARDEMTKHEPYYRDWAVEHTEDFVPAIRAALAGDHQLAATILRELFGDYTDAVLNDTERRREVADLLS